MLSREPAAQVRAQLVRAFHAKLAAGYIWYEGDVEWSERNTVLYPAICSLAGVVAGAFGVGGGVVKVSQPEGLCSRWAGLSSASTKVL